MNTPPEPVQGPYARSAPHTAAGSWNEQYWKDLGQTDTPSPQDFQGERFSWEPGHIAEPHIEEPQTSQSV